jgi:hypothetical protein
VGIAEQKCQKKLCRGPRSFIENSCSMAEMVQRRTSLNAVSTVTHIKQVNFLRATMVNKQGIIRLGFSKSKFEKVCSKANCTMPEGPV